jgi:hypothetical protein
VNMSVDPQEDQMKIPQDEAAVPTDTQEPTPAELKPSASVPQNEAEGLTDPAEPSGSVSLGFSNGQASIRQDEAAVPTNLVDRSMVLHLAVEPTFTMRDPGDEAAAPTSPPNQHGIVELDVNDQELQGLAMPATPIVLSAQETSSATTDPASRLEDAPRQAVMAVDEADYFVPASTACNSRSAPTDDATSEQLPLPLPLSASKQDVQSEWETGAMEMMDSDSNPASMMFHTTPAPIAVEKRAHGSADVNVTSQVDSNSQSSSSEAVDAILRSQLVSQAEVQVRGSDGISIVEQLEQHEDHCHGEVGTVPSDQDIDRVPSEGAVPDLLDQPAAAAPLSHLRDTVLAASRDSHPSGPLLCACVDFSDVQNEPAPMITSVHQGFFFSYPLLNFFVVDDDDVVVDDVVVFFFSSNGLMRE